MVSPEVVPAIVVSSDAAVADLVVSPSSGVSTPATVVSSLVVSASPPVVAPATVVSAAPVVPAAVAASVAA